MLSGDCACVNIHDLRDFDDGTLAPFDISTWVVSARFHLFRAPIHCLTIPGAPKRSTESMASVSSLDKDLRKLRLDKYTPAAANEAKSWIEGILGERLPSGDLLEALKDGVTLCRYVIMSVKLEDRELTTGLR